MLCIVSSTQGARVRGIILFTELRSPVLLDPADDVVPDVQQLVGVAWNVATAGVHQHPRLDVSCLQCIVQLECLQYRHSGIVSAMLQ